MPARAALIAALLVMPAASLADDAAASFRALLVEYRCPVVDRLEQIYAAIDRAHPQNLFLIIYLAGRPQDYVQCVFDTRTRMLCEASSGYYDSKPDEPRAYRLPARSIAALGRLGFSTDDSAGNFQIWLDVSEPPDLNRIADFTLKALHDGYGARRREAGIQRATCAAHIFAMHASRLMGWAKASHIEGAARRLRRARRREAGIQRATCAAHIVAMHASRLMGWAKASHIVQRCGGI